MVISRKWFSSIAKIIVCAALLGNVTLGYAEYSKFAPAEDTATSTDTTVAPADAQAPDASIAPATPSVDTTSDTTTITTTDTATPKAKKSTSNKIVKSEKPISDAVGAEPIGAGAELDPTLTATADAGLSPDGELVAIQDPYETFNRHAFVFNDKVDTYILKPIATFYNKIMPRPINRGIHNFFNNINLLPTIANDLLQVNFYQAANDAWRLGINTTIGIGGLFDVGSQIGLMPYTNDFGMTLWTWGWRNSNYFVIPFWGPSTIRDGLIGMPMDYYAFSIYPRIYPSTTRYIVYGVSVIDRRAQLLQYQNIIDEAVLDQYVFVRNAFLQHRAYQLEDNLHRGYAERKDMQQSPVSTVSTADVDAAATPLATAADANDIVADPSGIGDVEAATKKLP